MSKYRSKRDQNPAEQTLNPVALCLISEDLDGSALPTWLPATCFSLLDRCHSLCAAPYPPGQILMTLWHLQHFGVSRVALTLLSQLNNMASRGLHAGTPLPMSSLSGSLSPQGKNPRPLYSDILHDPNASVRWTALPSLLSASDEP